MNELKVKTKVIGVDLTLNNTTCAVVDIRGTILAKEVFPTSDYPDISTYVSVLYETIMKLVRENGGTAEIRSVGISAPSSNYMTGSIENAANLPWKGVVPLAAMLRDRLGMAVVLANDGYVTALGEHAFGSAHGMNDFVVMTFSMGGVGSCVFTNGKPHLGNNGFAGEIGHTCIELNGRQCGCGHKGCLERYVSTRGILDTAREMMAESDEPSLMRNIEHLNFKAFVLCCRQGDKLAIEAVRRTGTILGRSIANYATALNPEAVVLTGDINQVMEWLLEPTRESLEENVFHNLRGKVKILPSILETAERTVLGASALAWGVKEYSLFK